MLIKSQAVLISGIYTETAGFLTGETEERILLHGHHGSSSGGRTHRSQLLSSLWGESGGSGTVSKGDLTQKTGQKH